jgi:recombinase
MFVFVPFCAGLAHDDSSLSSPGKAREFDGEETETKGDVLGAGGHRLLIAPVRHGGPQGFKGKRVGNLAYGYRLDADGCHLEPEPHEQTVIAKIRHLRDRRRTLRAIAADLNATGLRTRSGTSWRLEHVARILGSQGQAKRRSLQIPRG